jgi:hypothetical protein
MENARPVREEARFLTAPNRVTPMIRWKVWLANMMACFCAPTTTAESVHILKDTDDDIPSF